MQTNQHDTQSPDQDALTVFTREQEKVSAITAKTSQKFRRFSTITLFAILIIVIHQVFALLSEPVGQAHALVHVGLLLAATLLALSLMLLWTGYRELKRYQRTLLRNYEKADSALGKKTRKLDESQSLLESIFNAFRDQIVVVDRNYRIIKANHVAIEQFGHDLIGAPFESISPPCVTGNEHRSERRLLEHTFRTGEAQQNRLIGRCTTDSPVACEKLLSVNTYPVSRPDGDIKLIIEVVRDITDTKSDEILHAHEEKMAAMGLLAAGLAHDLNNPLASVSSELQLLEGEEDIARIQDSLKTLERHIDRIAQSVSDILGFVRTHASEGGETPVQQAVSDSLRLISHDPRSANTVFDVHIPAKTARVQIKKDELILVLVNIIINALDALTGRGKISIGTDPFSNDSVILWIKDDGEGMAPETLSRARSPLFTTKPEGSGSGLGLAITNHIITRAGGKLDLSSTPGQGTTVKLTLPAAMYNLEEAS